MVLTNHAKRRLQDLAPLVGRPAIRSLFEELRQTPETGNHAVLVPVEPKKDPARNQWGLSDRLAAIVRNGRVVTVCLTRSKQANPRHFRVERVI